MRTHYGAWIMQSHVVPTTPLYTHKHTQTCMHGQPLPEPSASGLPQLETSESPQSVRPKQGPEMAVMEGPSGESSGTTLEGNMFPTGAGWRDTPAILPTGAHHHSVEHRP